MSGATFWLAGRVRCPWCYGVGALVYSDGRQLVYCSTDQSVLDLVSAVERDGGTVAVDRTLDELAGRAAAPRKLPNVWCPEPASHEWRVPPWRAQRLVGSRSRSNVMPLRVER